MAWNTIDNITFNGGESDITTLLTFPTLEFPYFWGLVLFSIMTIIGLKLFFSQKEREGRGDFFGSFSVAGFATVLIALILNLLGVVDLVTLVFTMSATFVLTAIYLLTKD